MSHAPGPARKEADQSKHPVAFERLTPNGAVTAGGKAG